MSIGGIGEDGAPDEIATLKAAIVAVAVSDARRAAELEYHFHRHVEELAEETAAVRSTALLALAYGVVAFAFCWYLHSRTGELEDRLRGLAGGAFGRSN